MNLLKQKTKKKKETKLTFEYETNTCYYKKNDFALKGTRTSTPFSTRF